VGFTLVEEVGRGGMGVVWRARDDQTGQIVALKLLRDLYVEDESYRVRFEHELDIARRITSPHVVKVLGYGAREGVPYIAFEFINGRSLRQMLIQHGPYTWHEVRALLLQLAEGLADAHAAGVIHRDVKPSNVLVDDAGTAKLADFGISRALDVTRVTKASGLLGTPAYLAPEGPIDARSDLYSLGVVAFELLAGSPPFEGGTYHEVLVAHIRRPPDLAKVPVEARPIVSWLLAKEPNSRAQSARQLIRVLTGAEGIPALRPAAAPNSGGGYAPDADQVTVVAPRAAASWSGLSPAVASSQGRSGARQSPSVIIAGAIAVIAVVGALAVVALGRPGTASPQAISLTQAPAATASDTAGLSGPTGTDPTTDPTVAAPNIPQPVAPAGSTGQWLGYGALPEALWGSGVAQLPDGRVAIFSADAGNGHTGSLDSWLLDPQTGNIDGGPYLVASQAVPAVAAFDGGSVLIAGGWKGPGPVSSAQILDGTTGSFIPAASMLYPRSQATATDIGSGRVLVVGGWIALASGVYTATTSAEIFDRRAGYWSAAASMSTPRALATATRLQDGRVLVAGGDASWQGADAQGATQTVLSSAEIYDPSSNTWQDAGNMSAPRAAHSAALLPNGHVLVEGGWSDGNELGVVSVDEYAPGAGWSAGNSMPTPHAQGRLVTLKDGRLLAVGGVDGAGKVTANTDLYDPGSGRWQRTGSLQQPLCWPAVTVLNDGRVLLVGGSKGDANGVPQLEIYSPPLR
jgi:eukaryotic-like serine/threonine-protein kinase